MTCALAILFGCSSSHPTTDLPTSEIIFNSKVTVNNQSNTVDYVVYLNRKPRPGVLELYNDVELSSNDALFLIDQVGKTEFRSVGEGTYEIKGREFIAGTSSIELERTQYSETITVDYSVPGQILLAEPSSKLVASINDNVFVSWTTTGSNFASDLGVTTPNIVISDMRCFDSQSQLLTGDTVANFQRRPNYPKNDDDTSATLPATEVFKNEYQLTESQINDVEKCTAKIGVVLQNTFNTHVVGLGDIYVRGDDRYANDNSRDFSYGTIDIPTRLEEVEFLF